MEGSFSKVCKEDSLGGLCLSSENHRFSRSLLATLCAGFVSISEYKVTK